MIAAIANSGVLQKALTACFFACILCGIIGVIIIEKKLVMMCGGIAHTSYGGVGLGYLLGFEPIIGAFVFALLSAFGIGYLHRRGSDRSDVFNGIVWSLGMSLGILFVHLRPGYPPALDSYLFGSITSVTKFDINLTAVLTILVLAIIIIFYNYWKAYLFDEEFAAVSGVRVAFLEYLMLAMTAMAVVVLIRVVGIILILALLLAPAATASLLSANLSRRMIYATILGWIYCFAGIWLTYEPNLPTGSVIAVVAVASYLLVFGAVSVKSRILKRRHAKG